jgi:hypothetical protein
VGIFIPFTPLDPETNGQKDGCGIVCFEYVRDARNVVSLEPRKESFEGGLSRLVTMLRREKLSEGGGSSKSAE